MMMMMKIEVGVEERNKREEGEEVMVIMTN